MKNRILTPFILILLLGFTQAVASHKIIFINSYHDGYAPSDEVTDALLKRLDEASIETKVLYMDTKRNSDPMAISLFTSQFLLEKNTWQPDLVIAADDNAARYIVAPYLKNGDIPVVFCGVNWDCTQYGLPASNVTGMLEVLPLPESIETLKAANPGLKKMLVLSENSNSERSNETLLDPLFREHGLMPDYELVDTFAEWKEAFRAAQSEYDLIYLPTNGAIANWDEAEAEAFAARYTEVPTFTCDDFMMRYCAFGRTKIAAEQGQWSADTAIRILAGEPANTFPVTKNQQSRIWVNKTLADKINLKLPADVMQQATLLD